MGGSGFRGVGEGLGWDRGCSIGKERESGRERRICRG